jgi:hypothetical protein
MTMITERLEIRKGTVADIPLALSLIEEFVEEALAEQGFKIDPALALSQIKEFVHDSVVAMDVDRMVGVLAGKMSTFPLSDQQIFHEQIWFVSKPYRSTVGPKLLSLMEDDLKSRGIKFVVMVHLGNSKSEIVGRYYERLGYKLMESHYLKQL